MKLFSFFILLICFYGCSPKDKNTKKTPDKDTNVRDPEVFSPSSRNFAQLTSNEKIIIKDALIFKKHQSWNEKVKKILSEENENSYSVYLEIKDMSIKEASLLLKDQQLSEFKSNGIHRRSHLILKKQIGDELYQKYLEALREENTRNKKEGFNYLIKF